MVGDTCPTQDSVPKSNSFVDRVRSPELRKKGMIFVLMELLGSGKVGE